MKLRSNWDCLVYLMKHKWFVFKAGLKTKAPLWRLIIHDWSKFTPSEWGAYRDYFHGRCSVGHLKNDGFCGSCRRRTLAFKEAWRHHIKYNPHHWEYWVNGSDHAVRMEMPRNFVREMVADWAGAGRAITGDWEFGSWYLKNRFRIKLDPKTRDYTEYLLCQLEAEMNGDINYCPYDSIQMFP